MPDSKQAIAIFKRTATKLQKQAASLVITDDEQMENAAALLGTIKGEQKDLKAQKKKIIDPMQEALKEIKALFAEPEGILMDIEKLLKDGMLEYHNKKDAAAQKQIESINNRIGTGRGKLKVETAIAKLSQVDQADANIQTSSGGAQFKLGPRKLRITDPVALLKARPDLLLRPRVMEAIRLELTSDLLKDVEGSTFPPGVEVFREKLVAGVAA